MAVPLRQGQSAMPQPTLTLEYDPASKRWSAACDARPGLRTQGITLRKARHRLLRELRRADPQLVPIEVIKLPEPEASAYTEFQSNRQLHAKLEFELPEQRLQLAQRLIQLQMTVADAARLLQLSPQRLALHLHADIVTEEAGE
jgi:hypothetical protein